MSPTFYLSLALWAFVGSATMAYQYAASPGRVMTWGDLLIIVVGGAVLGPIILVAHAIVCMSVWVITQLNKPIFPRRDK